MSSTVEPPDSLPELTESEYVGADAPAGEAPLKTRVILPFVIPLLALAIVAVLVLNISRVFLAGNKDAALVMGIVITLAILIGASLLAAAPRMSTAATALVLGVVLVVISLAGFVSLGPSLSSGEGGTTNPLINPAGPVSSTVKILAGPGLSFDGVKFTNNYDAKAGVVQIDYGGDSGHTLAIQDPQYAGFLLKSDGAPRTGKVKLSPGKYTIYCTVPGHEAGGMKATITVSAG